MKLFEIVLFFPSFMVTHVQTNAKLKNYCECLNIITFEEEFRRDYYKKICFIIITQEQSN